jgi:hypothetical protein
MKAFTAAVNAIVKNKKGGNQYFYHWIILNSLEKKVQIKAMIEAVLKLL